MSTPPTRSPQADRRPDGAGAEGAQASAQAPLPAVDPLEARLRALAAVPPPAALSASVQAQIEAERRAAPVRWTLAAASVAVWGLGLQQLVSWTAAQLATAV